jgi:hypothetical protein
MVDSWGGAIAEIGPLYPFVGGEVLFWIVGMALWVIWHIWQFGHEKRQFDDDLAKYGKGETLTRAMRGEPVS